MVATYALAAWVLFTWGTRLRNAAQDDESTVAFVIPVLLVALAIGALARPRRLGRLLAVAGSVAWLVRVPMMLGADHGVGFKVVHTALAAITWALAWWVLQVPARRPARA